MDNSHGFMGNAPGRPAVPACTASHYPAQGGYEGGSIESGGMPGDKSEGGLSAPTGDSETGNYASAGSNFRAVGPNGTADPALEGPPLAATVGPNGDTNQ